MLQLVWHRSVLADARKLSNSIIILLYYYVIPWALMPTAALTKLVKLCIVEADFPSSNWAQKATGFESYQRRSGSSVPLFGNLANKKKITESHVRSQWVLFPYPISEGNKHALFLREESLFV